MVGKPICQPKPQSSAASQRNSGRNKAAAQPEMVQGVMAWSR